MKSSTRKVRGSVRQNSLTKRSERFQQKASNGSNWHRRPSVCFELKNLDTPKSHYHLCPGRSTKRRARFSPQASGNLFQIVPSHSWQSPCQAGPYVTLTCVQFSFADRKCQTCAVIVSFLSFTVLSSQFGANDSAYAPSILLHLSCKVLVISAQINAGIRSLLGLT